MVRNTHILEFFRRICKLLFLRTKLVFVFYGATPALKRQTFIARHRQRENAQTKIRKTVEKLLLNHARKTLRALKGVVRLQAVARGQNVRRMVISQLKSRQSIAKAHSQVQQGWRVNVVKHLNQTGGFSRSLANTATDWPCLLLELLSAASEIDYFQLYFAEIQVSFLAEYCRSPNW